jgi:integrase
MQFLRYVDGGILRRRGDRVVAEVNINYKRMRASFDTEGEAEKWITGKRTTLQEHGQQVAFASDRLIRDATEASKLLDGAATLTQAAQLWIQTYRPHGGDMTVADAFERFRASKEKAKLRHRSIKNLKQALGSFVGRYDQRLVSSITTADIITWADSLKLAPYGFKWTIGHARSFFEYCRTALKVCGRNPLIEDGKYHSAIIFPEITEREPEILAPAEVKKILHAAESYMDGRAVPVVALAFFAGIRIAEILRLTWDDISFERRNIKIGASIAKTRSKRMVDISDNLMAFLTRYRAEGRIVPSAITWRRWREKVEAAAGVEWSQNAARHSFASYYIVKHDDSAKTALQLGHDGGADTLFQYYRGLASRDEATEFWNIMPQAEPVAVVMPMAAGA